MQAFGMDLFLLQPFKIWVQKIAISLAASRELQLRHAVLRDRSIYFMQRTQGMMRNSSAFVQHFNPACRVARMYPELPASRLLLSLSDFDLPLSDSDTSWLPWLEDLFSAICIGMLFIILEFPEALQESGIELLINFTLNVFVLFMYYMSLVEVFAPTLSILGFLLACGVYHVHSVNKRNSNEKEVQEEINSKLVASVIGRPKKAQQKKKYKIKKARVIAVQSKILEF